MKPWLQVTYQTVYVEEEEEERPARACRFGWKGCGGFPLVGTAQVGFAFLFFLFFSFSFLFLLFELSFEIKFDLNIFRKIRNTYFLKSLFKHFGTFINQNKIMKNKIFIQTYIVPLCQISIYSYSYRHIGFRILF